MKKKLSYEERVQLYVLTNTAASDGVITYKDAEKLNVTIFRMGDTTTPAPFGFELGAL